MILPAELSTAQRMLAEAKTVADFGGLRDYATSARAWARARHLGIEAENEAAVFILRAERGAGQELIRMAETGERSGTGWPKGVPHDKSGRIPEGPRTWDQGVTLASLGISGNDASYWMSLAAMQDDAFDAAIADALMPGPDGRVRRISKMSLYRAARISRGAPRARPDDPVAPFLDLCATGERILNDGMAALSTGDVMSVGRLGVRLVKAARAELDRRGVAA